MFINLFAVRYSLQLSHIRMCHSNLRVLILIVQLIYIHVRDGN